MLQALEKIWLGFREPLQSIISPQRLMMKLVVVAVLTALLLVSAFFVVFASHKHRLAFDQHQTAMRTKDDLETEWRQLLLEQNTWGASARVERLAKEKIGMLVPDYKTIEFIKHEHR
ncbi:MAG: cell division protein FtsL [Pontibacterium sp.]